jgi:hypothetical protein
MGGEIETTTTIDDAFDGETIDLFAVMNSSMVELQIEMELLENKEYLKDNWNYENSNGSGNATDVVGDEEDHPLAQPSPFPSPFPSLTKLDSFCDPEKITTTTTGSATSTATAIDINWQAMEPAQIGDQDYSLVSDYTVVGPAVALTPAKVGDQDYSPVSDYTSTTAAATKTTTAIATVTTTGPAAMIIQL